MMLCNVCGTAVQEGAVCCPGCGAVRQVSENCGNVQAMPEFAQPAPPPVQSQNVQIAPAPVPAQTRYPQQFSHSAFAPQAMPAAPDVTTPLGWFGWMMLCGFGWLIAPALTCKYAKDQNIRNFGKMMLILESVLTVPVIMLICAVIGASFLDWFF